MLCSVVTMVKYLPFLSKQRPTASDEFIPKVNILFIILFPIKLADAINTEVFLGKHSRTGITTMMARVSHKCRESRVRAPDCDSASAGCWVCEWDETWDTGPVAGRPGQSAHEVLQWRTNSWEIEKLTTRPLKVRKVQFMIIANSWQPSDTDCLLAEACKKTIRC